jgi:hypothetical protein
MHGVVFQEVLVHGWIGRVRYSPQRGSGVEELVCEELIVVSSEYSLDLQRLEACLERVEERVLDQGRQGVRIEVEGGEKVVGVMTYSLVDLGSWKRVCAREEGSKKENEMSGDLRIWLGDCVVGEELVEHFYKSPDGMALFDFHVSFGKSRLGDLALHMVLVL